MIPEKKERPSLLFFSQKIGVGKGLGLQEYMVIVDYGKEDELEVWGYSDNLVKYVMTLTMIVLTVGLLGLVLYWWKQWWLYFTHDACLLEDATSVLVVVSRSGMKIFIYNCLEITCRTTTEASTPRTTSPRSTELTIPRQISSFRMKIWEDSRKL